MPLSTTRKQEKITTDTSFHRERITWLSYILLGLYGYLQAAPGPLVPFLQETFRLNQVLESLYLSLFALGMILAGLFGKWALAQWSHQQTLWRGGTGMVIGALLFALGWNPAVTLLGTLVTGFFGSLLLVVLQAILVYQHGEYQSRVLSEANVAASLGAILSSICLTVLVIIGFGWRSMLFVPLLVFLSIVLFFRKVTIATPPDLLQIRKFSPAHLPLTFWFCWTILLLGVAIEWSFAFWGAAFLVRVVGVPQTLASGLMGVFFGAEIVSRIGASRLTQTQSALSLLRLALLFVLIGFPFFWLGPFTLIRTLGLSITGLGVGSFFPLSLSIAVNQAPKDVDQASARCVMGAGLAIFVSPLVFGRVADVIGLQGAYTIILALILLLGIMLLYSQKWVRLSPSM